jgi:hypothetical protein
MLPFALKVVWFALSFSGIFACWIVLTVFARATGSYWGPMLYCVFATILQGIFCLGAFMFPCQTGEGRSRGSFTDSLKEWYIT